MKIKSTNPAQIFKPNPPTPEAIEKAQFKDKTYIWKGSASYKAGKT